MDNFLKEKIISTTFEGLDKIIESEHKNHPNEKSYSCCRIQEGYNDYLKIVFRKGKINYFRSNFEWSTTPDERINCEELKEIQRDDFVKEIVPEIKAKFEDLFFKYEDSFLFRYKFLLVLEFEGEEGLAKDRTYKEEFYFENQKRKEELKNKMEEYIKEVFLEEKKSIKDERECVIFAGNLLDFNLMGYSEKYIIELIEKILQVMKSVKNRRFDTTSALLKIKYRTYSFDVKNACDDLENAMNNYHSLKAKQYLEKGSGTLADELIHYKDKDLECKANDILSTVDIKIKNEVASSYEKALDFITTLLNNGFPHSYAIKFSSKSEKIFLDIKGLAKSSTHRFFRRILDFPELYDKLEVYAKTAMKEFEWYQDVEEGEKSLLPGSYAVFALGLYDEKYFPLIKEYYSKLDDEHQLAHQSLPIFLDGFLSGQFDKVFKNLAILLEDEENKKLLIKELENYGKHERQTILYSIWKNKWQQKIKI